MRQTSFWLAPLLCVLNLGCGSLSQAAANSVSTVDSDEEVRLFPTYGWETERGWVARFHAWVYEPEDDSARRLLLQGFLAKLFGAALHPPAEGEEIFERRARGFLVDNERDEQVVLSMDGATFSLPRTGADGHAQGLVEGLPSAPTGCRVARVVFRSPTRSAVSSCIHFLQRDGVSVISDIDDTVKLTDVYDGAEMMRNTLYRPFRPVPGMADFYRQLASEGADFHYVSNSPWQLAGDLEEFLNGSWFPQGTLHLAKLRLGDPSVWRYLNDRDGIKRENLESILADFPERRFVLIGDSGENDPEIYGALARAHPENVIKIFIRRARSAKAHPADRLERAFAGLPAGLWGEFDTPPLEWSIPRS